MSLIKCRECGKEISNQAPTCPYCGISNYYVYNNIEVNQTKSKASEVANGTIAAAYISAFLIPIIGIIMAIYLMARGEGGHGIACLIIAINVVIFGVLAMCG